MFPEIGELGVDERPSRRRDEDLATVSGRGDPGTEVDVFADISLLSEVWPPGMQPHPHPDRAGAKLVLRLPRGVERLRRLRDGDEEGVPLRVHLDAAVRGEGGPEDPAMFGQCGRESLGTQLVQQPRRALDVGEQKGDGSGGKV